MPLTLGVISETAPGERRLSVVPDVVKKYLGLGARVVLQKGAGVPAHFPDGAFADVTFADSAAEICAQSDVVFCVQPPTEGRLEKPPPRPPLVKLRRPEPRSLQR